MSNVLIEKHTIDSLANAISVKSGESVPMTLTEMIQAVDGIDTSGGGGITPTGNIDITQSGVTDVTQYATATVPDTTAAVQSYYEFYTDSGVRKWRVKARAVIEPGDSYDPGWIGATIEEPYHNFNAVAKNTTITPTTSSQTIGGAKYMMEGPVTVNAMPTGTATPAASITATGASVSTGTNTLTLSKTVSNTPQVSAGYVSAGTAGNSSVSLTASVTTKAAATIYPGTTDQTIASGTYLTGTQTVKALTQTNLSAENIKSGTTISVNNGQSNVWSVTGTYSGGGGSAKNAQVVQQSATRITSTAYTKACGDITVSKTGTYNVYWTAYRTSTSGTWGTQLYIGSTAYGSAQTTYSSYYQAVHLSDVSLTANQKISVYGRSRGSNYYLYVGQLTIIEA